MNIYRSDKKTSSNTSYTPLTNKPQINGVELVGNKTSADLGIITKAVNDLVNYYLKTDTYSKTEIDTIIQNVVSTRFEVVTTLPTVDIKTNVIYLVPSATSQQENVKDEWINLDGTTTGWEQIGSTAVDLSNYVTTSALNSTLANYVSTTALNTLLASYVTSTDLATTLADYITSTDLETALGDYIDETALETALADYTTTDDLEDLLDEKQDAMQVSSMPTAGADYVGLVYQYIGSTTGTYTHGYFYECKLVNGSYTWVNVPTQDSDNIQVSTMPTASSTLEDVVVQYIGVTTNDYKNGYFYKCVDDNGTYKWQNQPVQDGGSGHTIVNGSGTSMTARSGLQFKGATVSDDSTNNRTVISVEQIQVTTLPTANIDSLGKIYQFIGTTTNDYINGFFYECVANSGSPVTYSWKAKKVQEGDKIQVSTLPAPSVDYVNVIYQYIGATNSNYTHGYFYECVLDGSTYVWKQTDLQSGSSTCYEKILSAGETEVIFAIPTSGTYVVNIYTSIGLNYSDITIIGGYITLTYPSQSSDITIYCELRETTSVIGDQLYDVASDVTIQTDQYKTINAVLEIKDNNWNLNLLFQNLSNVGRFNITIDMSAYLSNSATYTTWENVGEGRVVMAGGIEFTDGVLLLKTFDGNDGSGTKPTYNNVIFYGTV